MIECLYVLVCVIWGGISVEMQKKYYPCRCHKADLMINFLVNTLLAPISTCWALYRWVTKTGWAKDL